MVFSGLEPTNLGAHSPLGRRYRDGAIGGTCRAPLAGGRWFLQEVYQKQDVAHIALCGITFVSDYLGGALDLGVLTNGKRTAAIKSRAEAACRLCRDGAVKSPRSGIKAENGKLLVFRRETKGESDRPHRPNGHLP